MGKHRRPRAPSGHHSAPGARQVCPYRAAGNGEFVVGDGLSTTPPLPPPPLRAVPRRSTTCTFLKQSSRTSVTHFPPASAPTPRSHYIHTRTPVPPLSHKHAQDQHNTLVQHVPAAVSASGPVPAPRVTCPSLDTDIVFRVAPKAAGGAATGGAASRVRGRVIMEALGRGIAGLGGGGF